MIIKSICPYCGCGCELGFKVDKNKVVGTLPVKEDICSEGKPCIKGLTAHETIYEDRIKHPMIRKNGKLVKASWKAAYSMIKKNMEYLHPEEVYFTGSAGYSNETNYLLQKFAKTVFKTKNVDSCARLCHAATGIAYNEGFGMSRIPHKMDDVLTSDVIFTIGTNPANDYPVFFDRIQKARSKGAKLVSVDIDPHETTVVSDYPVYIKAESIIVFLSGVLREITVKAKQREKEMRNFKTIKEKVNKFTPEYVSKVCGIKQEDFEKVLDLIVNSKRLTVTHGMGITQRFNGTQNCRALTNIGLLKNAKFIPLRGKINVQGAGDMGCNTKHPNYITNAFFNKPLKALYVMGMDPAMSFPNLNLVHKKMRDMFVVVQHTFPTETMKFADVVLPSSLLFEEDGTITNGESRVRRVNQVIPPVGGKKDWEIICDLAKEFGFYNFDYKNEKDIFEEITKIREDYEKLSWKKVSNNKNNFTNKHMKYKRLINYDTSIPSEVKTKKRNFVLTTMRSKFHFCTGEATLKSKTLKKIDPEALCSINERDARKLGVKNGDFIKITSDVASIKVKVKIDKNANSGTITVPFHFNKVLINKLFPSEGYLDMISGTPNFKAINVSIKKVKK